MRMSNTKLDSEAFLERTLKKMDDYDYETALKDINVGIELPAEPDKRDLLFDLIHQIHTSPVKFLNLNELEITVGNQENMDVRGFNLAGGITAAAEGSAQLAIELRDAAKELDFHLKFCC